MFLYLYLARSVVVFLCILLMPGCATIYNPVTQRSEYILIDTAAEVRLGGDFARQIENQLELSKDPNQIERVESIGKRVAAVSDRQDLEYHFGVIKDKGINAFALPGGYIYVNTGLLDIADDDELACVLAHEVAHVAARHSVKAMQGALGYDLFTGIVLGGAKYKDAKLLSSVLFNMVHLRYSRKDEELADRVGILYAYRAGFDPNGLVTFFKKLKAQEGKGGGGEWLVFLRSHPTADQRIADAKKEIELLVQGEYNSL